MNTLFFTHEALTLLSDQKRVEVDGTQLTIMPQGWRYEVSEAVRVVVEVITGEDEHGLVGKVCTCDHLVSELGGELLGDSLLIDDGAYDVVQGFRCQPVEPPEAGGPPDEREILQSLQDELS